MLFLKNKFPFKNVIREPIERIGAILQNRYELTPLNFTKTKNIMKSIVITGCSSGFGYETTKYLAEKGHTVYATMRNLNDKNEKPAAELRGFAKESLQNNLY